MKLRGALIDDRFASAATAVAEDALPAPLPPMVLMEPDAIAVPAGSIDLFALPSAGDVAVDIVTGIAAGIGEVLVEAAVGAVSGIGL